MENVKNDAICHVTRQNQYNPAGGGATITCGLLNFVPGRTVTDPVRISNLVSSPISINSKTILGELRPVVYDTNDENTAAAVNMSVNTGEEECKKKLCFHT